MVTKFESLRLEKIIRKTRDMRQKAHIIENSEKFSYKSASPNTSKRDSSKGSSNGSGHDIQRISRKLSPIDSKLSIKKCLSDKSVENNLKEFHNVIEILRSRAMHKNHTKPSGLFFELGEKREGVRYNDIENSDSLAEF